MLITQAKPAPEYAKIPMAALEALFSDPLCGKGHAVTLLQLARYLWGNVILDGTRSEFSAVLGVDTQTFESHVPRLARAGVWRYSQPQRGYYRFLGFAQSAAEVAAIRAAWQQVEQGPAPPATQVAATQQVEAYLEALKFTRAVVVVSPALSGSKNKSEDPETTTSGFLSGGSGGDAGASKFTPSALKFTPGASKFTLPAPEALEFTLEALKFTPCALKFTLQTPAERAAHAALRALGIAAPLCTQFVADWQPEYIQAVLHAVTARGAKVRDVPAFVVACLREGWTLPELRALWDNENGEAAAAPASPAADSPAPALPPSATPDPKASAAQAVWEAALADLELQMTRATFDTWLRGTRAVAQQAERLVIGVKSGYAVAWLSNRLQPLITRTLARVAEEPLTPEFVVWEPHTVTDQQGGQFHGS